MYTVFIVDDESKVINGLIKRIQWDRLDACVIGYAQNGKEAEEKILELQEKKAALLDTISGCEETRILNMSSEELLSLLKS